MKNFDTSKVTSMYDMFYNNKYLTSLDLSTFKTDKLENIRGLFSRCSSLLSIDLYYFDFEKIKFKYNIFYGCDELKYVRHPSCKFPGIGNTPNFTCITN